MADRGAKKAGSIDFDDLFRLAWPRAVATARRIVGPPSDPEAVAAEALTRACDRWRRVGRLPAPDVWVLRETIDIALDTARRQSFPSAPVIDLRDSTPAKGIVDAGGAAARGALGVALRALPDTQRHAVGLRYLAGCQEAEIAVTLGMAPEAVRTHLERGLEKLRAELGTDLEASVAVGP